MFMHYWSAPRTLKLSLCLLACAALFCEVYACWVDQAEPWSAGQQAPRSADQQSVGLHGHKRWVANGGNRNCWAASWFVSEPQRTRFCLVLAQIALWHTGPCADFVKMSADCVFPSFLKPEPSPGACSAKEHGCDWSLWGVSFEDTEHCVVVKIVKNLGRGIVRQAFLN